MTTPGQSPSLDDTKARLRTQALARRDALTADMRAESGSAIAGRIARLSLPPGPVAAYWPIRSEADPRHAARLLREHGREIALPCVTGDHLVFRRWSEGDTLVRASLGLMEPPPDAAVLKPTVLLVPLAAFDRRGHRIGYGRGFYDRALATLGPVTTIGVAFAAQEIPLIPDEPHDHPLNFVVTERETIDTRVLRGS
jgi:5-formyltetrahydrofolate cyclo-ligase